MTLAQALMQPGFVTTLIEPDVHAGDRARFFLGRVARDHDPAVLTPAITADDRALCTADIVVDAPPGALGLRSDALMLATDSGGAPAPGVVRFHLFAPAHMRRLVEITPGPDTPADRVQAAMDLARDMGRIPVLATAGLPSVGTRLQRRLYETAEGMLLQGVIPHELDEAMVAYGFDLGLFEAQDLIGLDVAYGDRKRSARPAMVFDRMVQEGRLGKKAGVGWYRYPGGGGAVIDPLLEDLIREEARFAGVQGRHFTVKEMQKTLVQALINEGMAILADGIATAGDITRAAIHGLGYPPARVGDKPTQRQPAGFEDLLLLGSDRAP